MAVAPYVTFSDKINFPSFYSNGLLLSSAERLDAFVTQYRK